MALDPETAITWYGHSCVEITTPGGVTVLIDPWFGNPKSPKAPEEVDRCDVMLVTHSHFDHFGGRWPSPAAPGPRGRRSMSSPCGWAVTTRTRSPLSG
jgi:glyoxylase-like metal-dependent hydrolase (beta-lactamase superfamily II)